MSPARDPRRLPSNRSGGNKVSESCAGFREPSFQKPPGRHLGTPLSEACHLGRPLRLSLTILTIEDDKSFEKSVKRLGWSSCFAFRRSVKGGTCQAVVNLG